MQENNLIHKIMTFEPLLPTDSPYNCGQIIFDSNCNNLISYVRSFKIADHWPLPLHVSIRPAGEVQRRVVGREFRILEEPSGLQALPSQRAEILNLTPRSEAGALLSQLQKHRFT